MSLLSEYRIVSYILLAMLAMVMLWNLAPKLENAPGYKYIATLYNSSNNLAKCPQQLCYTFNNCTQCSQQLSLNNGNSCVVILKQQLGRLGNLMFKFASAYGLARHHRCKLYVDELYLKELNTIFELEIEHISMTKSEYSTLTGVAGLSNHACHYLEDIMKPNAIKYVEISGYWQAFGHFIKYTHEIRQLFTFRSEIIQQVTVFFREHTSWYSSQLSNSNLAQRKMDLFIDKDFNVTTQQDLRMYLRSLPFTLVGVHWRRGDFLWGDKLAYGHHLSSLDYLKRAMDHFVKKYYNVLFILASDDKEYCQNVFKNNSKVIVTPGNFSREQDLATLVVCQHTILTGGSFGWFAAYLAGGDVLCDRLFPPKNTTYEKDCPSKDYFPSWFFTLQPLNQSNNSIEAKVSP